ncbi:DNA polymerase delta subunit 2 [Candida albicans P34048]|nr:DNA polymerase delta subunit 2 [Candida albicans P34048]
MSSSQFYNKGVDESVVSRQEIEEFTKRNEFFLKPGSRKYAKQYFSMYQYRLKNLRDRVHKTAMEKWGHGTKKINGNTIEKQDKILDIASGKLCWVIGTVFCDAKYKLDILNDVEKGTDDVLPLEPVTYVNEDEQPIVMLEDESGRAILNNDNFLAKNLLVTGCIVAVLGIEIQAGIFEIMDIAYPDCAPQKPLPLGENKRGKIALVSGLNIGDEGHYDLKLELLKQYLLGELGNAEDKLDGSLISQLIIAGDSIMPIQNLRAEMDLKNFVTTNNYGSKNISKYNVESFKKLDEFLTDILVSLPVAVMPGKNDPAEICLPQQPLHRSLFKNNSSLLDGNRLTRLTNPQWIDAQTVKILGTSGQNVDDIQKYIVPKKDHQFTSIEIMENNIKWQNFVPTAPDTLYCYPYENYDPFIFSDDLPHVYFVGNQQQFDNKLLEHDGVNVRLISIPKFKESGQFVLLDLDTLETEVVTIEI